MKLLVVSHSCATATNQRLYAELEALTGWSITLAIPANWKDEFGNVLDQTPFSGFKGRVVKVPVFVNGNIILHVYRKAWKSFMAREGFDAVYVNHEPYALATAHICLATPRGTRFGFYSCQNIEKKYPFPFSALEAAVYKRSEFAFPITDAVADVLRAKGFHGDLSICALPLDPDQYHPRGEAEDLALLPRKPGEVVVGFVGRLVESKGLRTLAAALARLKDIPWKLVLIGKGDFEDELRSIAAKEGIADQIEFLGYVPHDEAPKYLSAFDVLVLPSETQPNWKEQFGRVITEAMACGTPVIGSDSGEIPHLIRASGGGLIFPERNAMEFARALRTLLTSPELRKQYADLGMAWVRDNVSLRAIATKMAATLQKKS